MKLNEIFNEEWDRIDPFQMNEDAKRNYERCLGILTQMKTQGKLDFEFTPVEENYSLHTIHIVWEDDWIEASQSEMRNLATLFSVNNGFLMDNDRRTWQFTTQIYCPL